MGCLLEWKVDLIRLIPCTKQDGHHIEGAICYCIGCTHMGILLIPPEGSFHCDNQAMVDIWDGAEPVLHTQWLWFTCCIFVLVITT